MLTNRHIIITKLVLAACLWLGLGSSIAYATCTEATDMAAFRSCLTGSSGTCTLPTGTHTILCGRLWVQNYNLTLIQGGSSNPADTTLLRGDGDEDRMMYVDWHASGLVIQNLTFDGNRWGFGSPPDPGVSVWSTPPNISCVNGEGYWDLEATKDEIKTISHVNFINSPGAALALGGDEYVYDPENPENNAATYVAYSNFGQLGDTTKAPRQTSIYLAGTQTGAYINHTYWTGTAGITLWDGDYQYVYGNLFFNSRYEMVGGGGGSLTVYDTASAASIAANVVDGNGWQTPASGYTINGCPSYGAAATGGAEVYGDNIYFYNNEISNHTGGGMAIGVGIGASNIVVSGSNPFDGGDSPRYIIDNGYTGIWADTVSGITLDAIRVCNSGGGYGVWLEDVTGTGFTNNATMSGNSPGNINIVSSTLTYSSPGTISSCP